MLAPIVDHAADARVPESTRSLLAQVARRYGVVACVSGRRASEARALVAIGAISYLGSHGAEVLRAGWTEPVVDPGILDWTERIHDSRARPRSPDLRRRRVRLEDKGAIVAFHWRGAPNEEAARAAIDSIAAKAEAAGLRTHWGRKVLEVRPPVRIDKGAGILSFLADTDVDVAMYVGDDATDLDAFHALVALAEEGRISRAIRVGVRSDEGPPRSPPRPTSSSTGRTASPNCSRSWPQTEAGRAAGVRFSDFLRTTVLISAAAASALAAVTVAAAAGTNDDLLVPISAGWWVIAALIGAWMGRRAGTTSQIASLLASARTQSSLPEVKPGPHRA